MASSKESGTAVAATEQLGSISLGESAERKVEPETTEDDQNEASAKLCSACDKKSNTLKKCTACKCVWYCDKKCQNKHWKEHKKECKLIKKELDQRGGKLAFGTEEDIGPPALGKVPPREECSICMHVLPIHLQLRTYNTCCGKNLCGSCEFQHSMKSGKGRACAFCRTAVPESEEEALARMRKRVERKDPNALFNMSMHYGRGRLGLPVDEAKCIDLLRQSVDLGYPEAQYQLGQAYHHAEMGLEQNEEEALKYYKKAAEGGHMMALHNLACTVGGNGDFGAAMRHWRLAASRGYRVSMNSMITRFEDGVLRHGDLAETLQAFYVARAEMWSKDREQYIAYLKMTGEYDEEYDV